VGIEEVILEGIKQGAVWAMDFFLAQTTWRSDSYLITIEI
jgi:hypothetical protein